MGNNEQTLYESAVNIILGNTDMYREHVVPQCQDILKSTIYEATTIMAVISKTTDLE